MSSVREKVISCWGGKINAHVKIAGDGPGLIYFHGPYGLIWDSFLDQLAQSFTVHAPEFPGTSPGEPDAVKELDDMWDLVLYHDELLERLALKSPIIVGHSFGGMVAAEIAANFPNRVGKLVLIDSFGLWLDSHPIRNYQVMTAQELLPLFFHDPKHPMIPRILVPPTDPEALVRVTWAIGCTSKFSWPFPEKGLRKRLHRLTTPALLIWGAQDGLVPLPYAEEFAKLIRGARVVTIDKAAHMASFEQPEQIAKAVKQFALSQ
jgi:pimeloyl-ACP methyl ester carboxylesterase